MHTSTRPRLWRQRLLAVSASAIFLTGALTILIGSDLITPSSWTSTHLLTLLTIFGTVGAGHLRKEAWRQKHHAIAIGFFVLFLTGTALVVFASVGRQAEISDSKELSAEQSNAQLTNKGAELERARKRLLDANDAADREMTGERCGQKCNDWKLRATEVQSNIDRLEKEIASIGTPKPVAPKASKWAKLIALLGGDEAKIKAILTMVEPFLWTLFFEYGIIVSLGYAFRPKIQANVKSELPDETELIQIREQIYGPDRPDNSGPNKSNSPNRLDPNTRFGKEEVLHSLLTQLAMGERFGSQDDMRERFGIPKSTLSNWLNEWEGSGVIPARRQVGRCKALANA